MRFTLSVGHWYALEMLGADFGPQLRTYSPIRVEGIQPGQDGTRRFHLDFYHANYPQGVQDKRYHLQTIERTNDFILARSCDHQTTRYLLFHELSAKWMSDHFNVALRRDADVEQWLKNNA